MEKFRGEFNELETLVSGLGYTGKWEEPEVGKMVFRSEDQAILNWWPSTGSLQAQGPAPVRNKLEAAVNQTLSGAPPAPVSSAPTPSISVVDKPVPTTPPTDVASGVSERVFVVYGHDETAREQLELVLHKLGLNHFVLGNTGGSGLTIIEALEKEILTHSEGKRFGIVLLTPDDMGYQQGDVPENAEPRARQNVVMEMGMLIAAFGRPRVAILKKGHLEVPSDASGIIYLSFNSHVRETVARLCQRLGEAGFEISSEAIAQASA